MAEIARQAGVGVASIYRRYPTKEALVEALRTNAVREAATLAQEVASGEASDAAPGAAPSAASDSSPDATSWASVAASRTAFVRRASTSASLVG